MGQKPSSSKVQKNLKNKFVSKKQTKSNKVDKNPPDQYIVKAKYKYDSEIETNISYDVNDIMIVINVIDDHWLEVIKEKDQQKGFVYSSYVRKQDGSPKSVEGWQDIQRWEAEKLLMKIGLEKGTYIIRPSRITNSVAFSVKDLDKTAKISMVKHFQIKMIQSEDGIKYNYKNRNFSNISSMIKFFQKTGIGNTQIKLTKSFPDNYKPPLHFQDIEINRDNVEILNEIGHGCFGSVYRARWGRSYEVAAKILISTKPERKTVLQEAKIMHKLRHRKIVELLGICSEPQESPIILILELLKNGSLKGYLNSVNGRFLNLAKMIHMMADITEGMSYLESKNVVHRDLRADNILVDSDLTVKVADFGLTEFKDDKKESKNTKFPYKWTAPEAAMSKIFTSKSDIWSFGIVMYEIITFGKIPYPDIPATKVIDKLLTGYRMPNPENKLINIQCPCFIYQIMLKCWNKDPEKRPSFSNLLDEFDSKIVEEYNNAN